MTKPALRKRLSISVKWRGNQHRRRRRVIHTYSPRGGTFVIQQSACTRKTRVDHDGFQYSFCRALFRLLIQEAVYGRTGARHERNDGSNKRECNERPSPNKRPIAAATDPAINMEASPSAALSTMGWMHNVSAIWARTSQHRTRDDVGMGLQKAGEEDRFISTSRE